MISLYKMDSFVEVELDAKLLEGERWHSDSM